MFKREFIKKSVKLCDEKDSIDGILLVDKPSGMTSHDVVLFIRENFCIKKVGHTGILDPMATGVLVVVLGKETKRANVFIDQDKEYQGILRLGINTVTQDREGKIIEEKDTQHLKEKNILDVLNTFNGEILQIPPMVSSRRYQGKRLYELARKGIEVQRQPKKVSVSNFKVEWIKNPFVSFRLTCSKGTYVRTICYDAGQMLGVGGCLYALQRIRSGPFRIEKTIGWPELIALSREELKKRLFVFEE